MASESSPRLRRVVVALDATGDFAPAIGFGGIAAAAWGTDLHALFAQDRRLRRAAGLPVAGSTVGHSSGSVQPMSCTAVA